MSTFAMAAFHQDGDEPTDQWQEEAFGHGETRIMPTSTIDTDEAPAHDPLRGKGYEHRCIHSGRAVFLTLAVRSALTTTKR